jgi:hypothetical protein
MICWLIGNVGSGKTFLMMLLGLFHTHPYYANFKIKHTLKRDLKVTDFLDLQDDFDVFIDEAYFLLDCRLSNRDINVLITQIVNERRKTNSIWYISSQYDSIIDTRFRKQSNIIIYCLTRFYETENFNYIIEVRDLNLFYAFRIPYDNAKEYFQYYDTKELLQPEQKMKMRFNLVKNDGSLLLQESKNIYKMFHNEYIKKKGYQMNEIVKDDIEFFCLDNEINTKFVKYVWMVFKTHKKEIERKKEK